MFWKTTSKAVSPIDLDQAKAFLRVDNTVDDAIIQMLIDACTELGETLLSKAMRLTVYSGELTSCAAGLKIHKAVVQRVDSVSYDDDGDTVVVDASDYKLIKSKQVASVCPAGNFFFPVGVILNVDITCDVDDELLPQAKQALLHHVNFLYENRGDVAAVDSLAMPLETRLFYNANKVVRV